MKGRPKRPPAPTQRRTEGNRTDGMRQRRAFKRTFGDALAPTPRHGRGGSPSTPTPSHGSVWRACSSLIPPSAPRLHRGVAGITQPSLARLIKLPKTLWNHLLKSSAPHLQGLGQLLLRGPARTAYAPDVDIDKLVAGAALDTPTTLTESNALTDSPCGPTGRKSRASLRMGSSPSFLTLPFPTCLDCTCRPSCPRPSRSGATLWPMVILAADLVALAYCNCCSCSCV